MVIYNTDRHLPLIKVLPVHMYLLKVNSLYKQHMYSLGEYQSQ